jgi:2-oxo-4-hydroxy-4-carboxy-5-ureidoimidazoline decarboxylase
MTIQKLNSLDKTTLQAELTKSCGSSRWVTELSRHHPFESEKALFEKAREIWFEHCEREDWLEAFTHHPKIGDVDSLAKKYAATKEWASGEQSDVQSASMETLQALAAGNEAYEKKFGYIFIVCATGKSAAEMLEILNRRLNNIPENEIITAMQEQYKITELRLKKLLKNI